MYQYGSVTVVKTLLLVLLANILLFEYQPILFFFCTTVTITKWGIFGVKLKYYVQII